MDSFACGTYPSGFTLVEPPNPSGARLDRVTDWMPGSASSLAASSRSNSAPFSSEYPAVNRSYEAISTLWESNPGLICCALMKLRMNNPAQISSKSDSEICATTNPLARRAFLSPPDALPVSSFSTAAGASLEARNAGKIPKITPVSTEITSVASNTVRSARTVSEIGKPVSGMNFMNVPAVQSVINNATAPPASASTRLSTSSCRTSRHRLAPSDIRMAISRRRPTARTSIRFATFAHANSSTRPAIVISIGSNK